MPFSIVHLSDPHFGEDADLHKIVAVENLVPDLQPDAVVISGDLTERARHGEFQAARAWVRELERTAPVLVIPGDHDVQWWKKPIGGPDPRSFENYSTYFGPVVSSRLQLTEAVVVGAVTTTGVELTQALKAPRTAATKGRLTRTEALRIKEAVGQAESDQARIVVMHHHVSGVHASTRAPLGNAPQALQWLQEAGVDLILCGHAHADHADVVNDTVVSVAGTVSVRTPTNVTSSFHRIVVERESVQVELYRWERDQGRFRRTDVFAFARHRAQSGRRVATGTL